jgi:hypothetical protein
MLDKDAQTTLNDLRFHWDDFYRVACKNGVWQASPLSDPSVTIERGTVHGAARGAEARLQRTWRTSHGRPVVAPSQRPNLAVSRTRPLPHGGGRSSCPHACGSGALRNRAEHCQRPAPPDPRSDHSRVPPAGNR